MVPHMVQFQLTAITKNKILNFVPKDLEHFGA